MSRSSNSARHWVPGGTPEPGLPSTAAGIVLAAHRILEHLLRIERLDRCNDFGFLGADSVGIEGDRRLHGRHRKKLEHMVRHHVAQRAGLLVELAAVLDADGLRNSDLNVLDLLPVPQAARTGRWQNATP